MQRVTGSHCILQAFQENNPDSVAAHRTAGIDIEAAAAAIGGGDASGLIQISATLGRIDACAARQGHVALIGYKRSGRGMYGSQGSGTCGLDVEAWAA